MKVFIFKEQTMLMKYCKTFCIYSALLIVMCGIWVEVGTAQSDWMPDANLRAGVLADLKNTGVVNQTATTFTQDNLADSRFTYLIANSRGITDLTGLEYATNLTDLTLNDNSISSISVLANLTSLTDLSLNRNSISSISVLATLTPLTYLDLDRNNISSISVLANLTSLTDLRLNRNSISSISVLANLTALTDLELNDNSISSISALANLTALTDLRLIKNRISDISALSGLTSLTELYLSENRISDISVLANLTDLEYLRLGRNRISNTDAVVGLTNLRDLSLHGNRITDIAEFQKLRPLITTGALTHLRLNDNVFDDSNAALIAIRDNNEAALRNYLWMRPSAIDANRAVTSEGQPKDPSPETFPFTIRFSEPVFGFQMEDIIIETELHTGTGIATLEALTPVGRLAQTYTATIRLPTNAAGRLRVIVRAGAAETDDGRIDPAEDRVFPWIAFTTLPPVTPKKVVSLSPSKVAMDKVIFNEIRNASDDKNDWIELKNITDEEASLTDYEISIVIESEPKMVRNTAKEDVDIVIFPEDYTLPAGGILLIVNTPPNKTDLIDGQEITDEASDPDTLPQYLIASEMKLPDVPYMLLLRRERDKNGKPDALEDMAGNYFRGFVDYGTQVFPLVHTFRPANRAAAMLTQGQAWQRVDVEKRGYTKEAWAVSGYQSGIGYKPGSALESSLGTPGYPNDTAADDSLAGRITFSEVMYATRGGLFSQPQWIELYNNTDTAARPINLNGWQLVVEARDSENQHRYSVIELSEDLYIAPGRTVLLVTRDRRHSGHLRAGQVYNLFRHDSSVSKLGLRENAVLPAAGFALQLLAPDGTLVDSAGNLDGKTGIDTPTWALPSGYTEEGARTSLIRRYEDSTALVGTDAASWVRAADVALPLALYYGHETDIGSPGYREGGVAPVMLSHFQARRTEAGVIVEWATVSETDNAGFNILRGQRKTGSFVKVNPTLILGGGTTADKQSYTYTDPTAAVNVPYDYRLEEVSLSGERRALATVRLRGHLSATGKLLWKWADVKKQ